MRYLMFGGSLTKRHLLRCNGKQLMITTTLYQALRQLQEMHPGLRVWTDEVCINQDDPEEKIVQIMLMDKIYRHARKVWAWLEESTDKTSAAVELMHNSIKLIEKLR